MGDRYWIQIKCGGCGESNPSTEDYEKDPMENGIYYAPSSGAMDFICSKCKAVNWITGEYRGMVVSPKELDAFYKAEGFE